MKITITVNVKNKLDEQRLRAFLGIVSREQERTGDACWRILKRFMLSSDRESEQAETALRTKILTQKGNTK